MLKQLKISIQTLIALTLLLGFVYPFMITGLSQIAFPRLANGSLIYRQDKPIGSKLIGQPFDDPKYFWSRPSATTPAYNGAASSGSNLGPTNPALLKSVQERIDALRKADPENRKPVPVDLVTASASGLDPHISPAAARYQAARVARMRNVAEETVQRLIAKRTQERFWGLFGEPTVNVLELNLDLDSLTP